MPTEVSLAILEIARQTQQYCWAFQVLVSVKQNHGEKTRGGPQGQNSPAKGSVISPVEKYLLGTGLVTTGDSLPMSLGAVAANMHLGLAQ